MGNTCAKTHDVAENDKPTEGLKKPTSDKKREKKGKKEVEVKTSRAKDYFAGVEVRENGGESLLAMEDEENRVPSESTPQERSVVHKIEALQHTMKPAVAVVSHNYLHPNFRQFTPIFLRGVGANSVVSCEAANQPQQVLAAGEDCSIALLNYETGHVMRRWIRAHTKEINQITRPLPSGMFATVGRDSVVRTWRLNQDDPLAELEGHSLNVTSVDLHPTAPLAVSGGKDNTVRLWDLQQNEELYCGDIKLNIVHFVRFMPSLNCVAQGGEDLTLRLWDVRTGPGGSDLSLSCTLEGLDYFPACAEIIDSRPHTLLTGHNGVNGYGSYICEWDLRMQKCLRMYTGHRETITSLKMAPSSVYGKDKFFSTSKDNTVAMWSLSTDPNVEEVTMKDHFPVPEELITSSDCTSDGSFITSHASGCLVVFKPHNKGEIPCLRYRYVGIMPEV